MVQVERSPSADLASRRIHIVDDDAAVRKAVEGLVLTFELAESTEVLTHGSITEFTEFLGKSDSLPGCVIIDLNLPDGGVVAARSKLLELDCDLPMVVMSGRVDAAARELAASAGAVAYLEKPFVWKQLEAAIKKALDPQVQGQ